jgi:hypothetical protein
MECTHRKGALVSCKPDGPSWQNSCCITPSLGADFLLVQMLYFDYVVEYMNKNLASFSSTLVDGSLGEIASNLAAGTIFSPNFCEIQFSRHW